MHELPWQAGEKIIKRLRELGMLGCIYYVGPKDQSEDYNPQENQSPSLTKAIRNAVVRVALTSLKSSMVVVFCRLVLTVGQAVTDGSSLIVGVIMGS